MVTKHSHGPNFGRRVDGCPRCAELAAGATPVRWAPSRAAQERADDLLRAAEIRAHVHDPSCERACTFGEW